MHSLLQSLCFIFSVLGASKPTNRGPLYKSFWLIKNNKAGERGNQFPLVTWDQKQIYEAVPRLDSAGGTTVQIYDKGASSQVRGFLLFKPSRGSQFIRPTGLCETGRIGATGDAMDKSWWKNLRFRASPVAAGGGCCRQVRDRPTSRDEAMQPNLCSCGFWT